MNTVLMPELESALSGEPSPQRSCPQEETCYPALWGERLAPRDVRLFTARFQEGEAASVYLHGEGDIDLYIFDRYGNLVAYDNQASCSAHCAWVPANSGEYLLKIVNNEPDFCGYQLCL